MTLSVSRRHGFPWVARFRTNDQYDTADSSDKKAKVLHSAEKERSLPADE